MQKQTLKEKVEGFIIQAEQEARSDVPENAYSLIIQAHKLLSEVSEAGRKESDWQDALDIYQERGVEVLAELKAGKIFFNGQGIAVLNFPLDPPFKRQPYDELVYLSS